MPQTTGLVQKVTVNPLFGLCCVQLGPSPTNTTLLFVQRRATDAAPVGHLKTVMIDAVVAAHAARREVTATHGSNSSEVTALSIGP